MLGLPARHARARRAGRRHGGRPGAALDGVERARVPLEVAQHAVRRAGSCAGARPPSLRRRPRGRRRSAGARRRCGWRPDGADRGASLALADGTVFRGRRVRRRRRGGRRGRLQHRDDRLPGDPHRSVVPRADRRDDLSRDRQRRREPRGRRVAAAVRARLRRARVLAPRRATGAREQSLGDYLRAHGIPGIAGHRHARAGPPPARRTARRRPCISTVDLDPTRLVAQGAGRARAGRARPRARGDLRASRTTGTQATVAARAATRTAAETGGSAAASSSPTTSASSATSCATWSRVGCRVRVVPATTPARRRAGAAARRRLPLERPRRSRRRRRTRGERARSCSARCRSSASASATRSSASRSAAGPTSSSSATTAPTSR